ncbi:MAG TPA: hypothetical protein VJ827_00185 [Rubrobacter sp.]|nr:hypothetical protein [Rubrobacter sp.]
MDLALYYAALQHRDRIDPDVVMTSVGWKTGEAKQRVTPAEPSTL